jgi:hypothetical protein
MCPQGHCRQQQIMATNSLKQTSPLLDKKPFTKNTTKIGRNKSTSVTWK